MSQLSDEEIKRRKRLSDVARRALEEADARREEDEERLRALETARENEEGGPKAIEPTRFGDWERKGIAYDF